MPDRDVLNRRRDQYLKRNKLPTPHGGAGRARAKVPGDDETAQEVRNDNGGTRPHVASFNMPMAPVAAPKLTGFKRGKMVAYQGVRDVERSVVQVPPVLFKMPDRQSPQRNTRQTKPTERKRDPSRKRVLTPANDQKYLQSGESVLSHSPGDIHLVVKPADYTAATGTIKR